TGTVGGAECGARPRRYRDHYRPSPRRARSRRPPARARRGPSQDDRPSQGSCRATGCATEDCGEWCVSESLVLANPIQTEAGDARREIRMGITVAVAFFVLFLGW